MIVVLDTNVLVSGLLKTHTAPARVVDMLLIERLLCAYDDRIMAEYADVLARPKFAAAIDPAERDGLLACIRMRGTHVTAAPLRIPDSSAIADPDDLPFAEVAVGARVEALVSGNVRHFDFLRGEPWRVSVLTPTEAMGLLCG